MAWTKFKTAALTGAALLLIVVTTAVIVNQTRRAALAADRKAVIASAESLVSALARGDADAFTAGLHIRNDAEWRLAVSSGSAAKGMADMDAALLEHFGNTDDVWRIRHTFPLRLHRGIPLDQRLPGAFEAFAENFLRRVDAEFAAAGDFAFLPAACPNAGVSRRS